MNIHYTTAAIHYISIQAHMTHFIRGACNGIHVTSTRKYVKNSFFLACVIKYVGQIYTYKHAYISRATYKYYEIATNS